MSKLAIQFIRDSIYEFGLAHCVYHPDDMPAATTTPEDDGGSSGPRRLRPRLPRLSRFDQIAGLA